MAGSVIPLFARPQIVSEDWCLSKAHSSRNLLAVPRAFMKTSSRVAPRVYSS